MNIFVLSEDPAEAAKMQCDKHVVKMILETAQMLCAIYPEDKAPYKRTHYNHPCTVWSRESRQNYLWLVDHGFALCEEYEARYGKRHKSHDIIEWCHAHMGQVEFPQEDRTNFVQCMGDEYKTDDVVKAYRDFYVGDKSRFAKWNKSTPAPEWYIDGLEKSTN